MFFRWVADSADGGDLIVVDPVETRSANAADRHVRPDSGTDLALARVVETDRADERFVEQWTAGFEGLTTVLPAATEAAAAAGVTPETVEALAAAFERPTLVYWGMGVNQSVQGTKTARALVDCCLATANLGRGSGPFSLTEQANSMGTRVCSSKGTWPGHRTFTDLEAREMVAETWGIPVERLPDDSGLGPVAMLEKVGEDVEAVYTVATNPVAGFPDVSRVADRLNKAFVVAQDAFRTETTELADVVLPAATWGESLGTAMNMERTVSRVRPATDTPTGVRSDLSIIEALADRLAPGLFDARPRVGV